MTHKIFLSDTTTEQQLPDKYARKFFGLDSIHPDSNKWIVVFSKESGEYSYQVCVQNVPRLENNHYHIFGYSGDTPITYSFFKCETILPPVYEKVMGKDYRDFVAIQRYMNEGFFVNRGLTPPALDESREGKFLYFLTEPLAEALAKASAGTAYNIVAVPAEKEAEITSKVIKDTLPLPAI